MPPPVDPDLVKQEREALKGVVARSFTADPRNVNTFRRTTLSWNVTVPPNPRFDIEIVLDDEVVQPQGSRQLTLTANRTFRLAARTQHAGRLLKRVSVAVDDSECLTETLVDAGTMETLILGEIRRRFDGSSDFRLDGDPTVVVGEGAISIRVDLDINVPNWFDADMRIGIKLAIGPGKPVKVTLPTVSVDVSWNFFEHLASLGCTGFIQAGMERITQAFLTDIIQSGLVPDLAAGLAQEVREFLDGLKANDLQRRTWVARIVSLSPAGFGVTACPKPTT